MAAAAIGLGISLAEEVIPGITALWDAIVALRAKNANLTAAQVVALTQTMTTAVGTLDEATVTQLAKIPPAPVAS